VCNMISVYLSSCVILDVLESICQSSITVGLIAGICQIWFPWFMWLVSLKSNVYCNTIWDQKRVVGDGTMFNFYLESWRYQVWMSHHSYLTSRWRRGQVWMMRPRDMQFWLALNWNFVELLINFVEILLNWNILCVGLACLPKTVCG
jgi:hypothetical protein